MSQNLTPSVKNMSLRPDTDLHLLNKKTSGFQATPSNHCEDNGCKHTKTGLKSIVRTISLKLGKSTDREQNLFRSEGGQDTSACQKNTHTLTKIYSILKNQDISITNCMPFLPCVIWKKSQKPLWKDRLQTYIHWPTLCPHLVGTKNAPSPHTCKCKFSSLTDWIQVILWVT